MSALTNISTEYNMLDILQDIGKNYFGEELATERIGMFGFITESLAHMYGAMVLDASIRSKEYLVSTALKRSTLLYKAYKLGIDLPMASPTNAQIYLAVKASDILDFGRLVSSNPSVYKFVIEKDTQVIIDEYTFMPEYDIEVTAAYSLATQKYIYTARYLGYGDTDKSTMQDYIYPQAEVFEDIHQKHIPCYRTGTDQKILLMKVDLKQIAKTTTDYVITDTSSIYLTGVDFPYPDQFVYFNIYYREASSMSWTYMKAVPKYDKNSYDENVIYYEIVDDEGLIRFDFTGFEPQYNSVFRIDIYSTLGEVVNELNYVGDGSDIKVMATSLDNRHTYSGLSIACVPISTGSDGKDMMTMDEMRSYIESHSSYLNAIITEPDITSYISDKDPINDYVVRKSRSDILNMTYDIDSKLRTVQNGVIPTRCLDVALPNVANRAGTFYDSGTELDSNMRYCSPFDIAITARDEIKVYSSNIKKTVQMTVLDSDEDSDINFRIDHVTITRNINSNTYNMRVAVMTDGDYTRALSNNNVNIGNTKKVVMLRGFTYAAPGSSAISGIFDFEFVSYSNDIFIFEANLSVDAFLDISNRTDLRTNGMNMYRFANINPGSSDINDDNEFIINGEMYDVLGIPIDPMNFRFSIGVYYLMYDQVDTFLYVNDSRLMVNKVATQQGFIYPAQSITIPGSANSYPKYCGLCEYTSGTDNFDYKLCDVYSNITDLTDLYVDMTDMVRISTRDEVNTDTSVVTTYMCDVPCMEVEGIEEYNDRMRDIVFGTKELLDEVQTKLINNFDIDYKFFNTAGPSKYFYLTMSNGSNPMIVDDLELTVSVNVGLSENYATLDTAKINEIKKTIKEEAELEVDKSNKLYMSNVLSRVRDRLSEYIKYIELLSINGNDARYRVLQYVKPEGEAYISEFISIPIDNISVTIE